MPNNMQLQKSALEYLNISVETWNDLSPEKRKKQYHKKIIAAYRENHPDMHPNLDHQSPEYLQFTEFTQCLNSLDYEQTIKESVDEVNDNNATKNYKDFDKNLEKNSDCHMEKPKSAQEFILRLQNEAYIRRWRNKKLPDPGTPYFDKYKELIPTLLTMEHYDDLQCCYNDTEDFNWVRETILIKNYLKKYKGIDDFVVALVSKNKLRIKNAFESMVNNIRADDLRHPMTTGAWLFFGWPSSIDQFIDHFCRFKPVDMGGNFEAILGLSVESVLDICKMLSLKLPYAIIDLKRYELDQELVRTVFKNYVNNLYKHPQLMNEESDPGLGQSVSNNMICN